MNARVFIRNDDVWTLDGPFRYFFDAAFERGLPVVQAVIPGAMEPALVKFLRDAKQKSPQLLDIVQHGWLHKNHAPPGQGKYEFGASRAWTDQQADIREGKSRMHRAFGEDFTPGFVPPYHGFDQNTVSILEEEGFKYFSAGAHKPKIQADFLDLPAQVSFSRYDLGTTSTYKAEDVFKALIQSIKLKILTGVLTHHADFKSVQDRRALTHFLDLLKALTARRELRALLFSQLETAQPCSIQNP